MSMRVNKSNVYCYLYRLCELYCSNKLRRSRDSMSSDGCVSWQSRGRAARYLVGAASIASVAKPFTV